MTTQDTISVDGYVIQSINATNFKVKLCNTEKVVLAYMSGRMCKNTINILVGDKVMLEISKHDLDKARIKFRYKH